MFVEVYYRRNVEDERATRRKDERKKFNCCKQFLWCAFYVRIEYPRIQFRARRWCRCFHVVSQLDLWLEDCALVINRECFHTTISAAVLTNYRSRWRRIPLFSAKLQSFIRIGRVSFNDNKATLIFFDIKNIERVKFKFFPFFFWLVKKNDFFEVLAAATVGERKMVNGSK